MRAPDRDDELPPAPLGWSTKGWRVTHVYVRGVPVRDGDGWKLVEWEPEKDKERSALRDALAEMFVGDFDGLDQGITHCHRMLRLCVEAKRSTLRVRRNKDGRTRYETRVDGPTEPGPFLKRMRDALIRGDDYAANRAFLEAPDRVRSAISSVMHRTGSKPPDAIEKALAEPPIPAPHGHYDFALWWLYRLVWAVIGERPLRVVSGQPVGPTRFAATDEPDTRFVEFARKVGGIYGLPEIVSRDRLVRVASRKNRPTSALERTR